MNEETKKIDAEVSERRATTLLEELRQTSKRHLLEWVEQGGSLASPLALSATFMAAVQHHVEDSARLVETITSGMIPQIVTLRHLAQRTTNTEERRFRLPKDDVMEEYELGRLHAALEGVEWDGDESGVTLHVHVPAGGELRVTRDERGTTYGATQQKEKGR